MISYYGFLLLLLSSSSICRHWSFYCDFLTLFSSTWMCIYMSVYGCVVCVCVYKYLSVCRFSHTVTFVLLVQIYFSSPEQLTTNAKSYSLNQLIVSTSNRFLYYSISSFTRSLVSTHYCILYSSATIYCCTHWTIFVFEWVCTAWRSVWRSDNNGKWHMAYAPLYVVYFSTQMYNIWACVCVRVRAYNHGARSKCFFFFFFAAAYNEIETVSEQTLCIRSMRVHVCVLS